MFFRDKGVLTALLGLVVGGGLRVLEGEVGRRRERGLLMAALRTDVSSLLSLLRTRRIVEGMEAYLIELEAAISAGLGGERVLRWRIPMSWDYFGMYEALLPRFPLLSAKQCTSFSQFYIYAKSATEVMTTRRDRADGTIAQTAAVVRTELTMMRRVISLGEDILGDAKTAYMPAETASLPSNSAPIRRA